MDTAWPNLHTTKPVSFLGMSPSLSATAPEPSWALPSLSPNVLLLATHRLTQTAASASQLTLAPSNQHLED